ncbi:chemotaxis protein histidine kinase CheA [Bacillus sp. SORGH_AS 510]|nr:chemotaxis protein histidine kinase CheA [Bacillus sp. SORGH_AS_0510]
MDLNNYLEMFIEESKEHLQSINDELLKLESDSSNTGIVNEIFRSAHTLKGMAGSMGFEDLASLTHEMENVLDLLRNSKLTITSEIMDVIFTCVDLIEKMVDSIEAGGEGKENVTEVVAKLKIIQNPDHADLIHATREVAATAEFVLDEFQATVINEAKKSGMGLYQIKVSLDQNCVMKSIRAYLVFQAAEELGELIQTIPPVEQIEEEKFDDSFTLLMLSERSPQEIHAQLTNVAEVREVIVDEGTSLESSDTTTTSALTEENKVEKVTRTENKEDSSAGKKKPRAKSIRVDIDKLDHLMNLFSELIIDRGRLDQIAKKSQLSELTETVEHMTRISTDLQGLILNMRMVQVEQVFNRFPRMIRDLAKELNKKVQLVIEGSETELDRTVIDEIGDPLVHLLRNALDHGLETAEERVAANKVEEGTIFIKSLSKRQPRVY